MRTLTINLTECRECPYRMNDYMTPKCGNLARDIPVYEYMPWMDRDKFPEFCPTNKDTNK